MNVVRFRLWYYSGLGFGGLGTMWVLGFLGLFNDYAALVVLVILFTLIGFESSILRSCLSKREWSEWQRL